MLAGLRGVTTAAVGHAHIGDLTVWDAAAPLEATAIIVEVRETWQRGWAVAQDALPEDEVLDT